MISFGLRHGFSINLRGKCSPCKNWKRLIFHTFTKFVDFCPKKIGNFPKKNAWLQRYWARPLKYNGDVSFIWCKLFWVNLHWTERTWSQDALGSCHCFLCMSGESGTQAVIAYKTLHDLRSLSRDTFTWKAWKTYSQLRDMICEATETNSAEIQCHCVNSAVDGTVHAPPPVKAT